jgi:hypothetical protein
VETAAQGEAMQVVAVCKARLLLLQQQQQQQQQEEEG